MAGSQTVVAGPLGRYQLQEQGQGQEQYRILKHSTPLMGNESGIMRRNRERRILLPSLVLLILMIGSVQASMKLCGSKLPEALSRLCVYGFNAMTKRTLDPMNFNLIEAGSLDLGFDDRSLLERLFLDGSAQMLKTRRLREGVFDECCLKSCSMDELLRYCASKPKT